MFTEEVFDEISARLEHSVCKFNYLEQETAISSFQVWSLLYFERTRSMICKLFTEVWGLCASDEPNGNSARLICLSSSLICRKFWKDFTLFLIWLIIVCNMLTNICMVILNVAEFLRMKEISSFHSLSYFPVKLVSLNADLHMASLVSQGSHDSSVGTVTRLQAGWSRNHGSIPIEGGEIFLLFTASKSALGPIQPPIQSVWFFL
jgi:hypothetical protein